MAFLEAAIQRLFLEYSLILGIPGIFLWEEGAIFSKTAGGMSVVLVEVGSCVCFYQIFCLFIVYCVNGSFGRTALSGYFYIKHTFSFNLTWKESFLKSTVHRLTFDKYLVLHQLFVKHQLCFCSLEEFPSSMTNLLMQYFCNFYNFGVFSVSVSVSVSLSLSIYLSKLAVYENRSGSSNLLSLSLSQERNVTPFGS